MGNILGKAYAINVLTPVKAWKTPILALAFNLFKIRATQWELRLLAFIHFARWVVLTRGNLPHFPTMAARESFSRRYLLFESNFNGSWNEYIDAFHAVLHFKLNLVWMWSDNFPGAVPLVPFKRYIDHNQLHNDFYYMAYPGSTIRDVQNALAASQAFDALQAALDAPDEAFHLAYRRFLVATQNRLGAHGGPGPEMT